MSFSFFKKNRATSGKNRRKYERVEIRNLVQIMREDGSEIGGVTNMYDLSEGGLRLICHELFDIHTILKIMLHMPEHNSTITVTAKVLWLLPIKKQKGAYYAGVEFLKMSDQDRNTLKSLIKIYSQFDKQR